MEPALKPFHVFLDDAGRAWIDQTNVKVIEVVRDHLAYGWSPEEIHWQHPHLDLAQIYAALAVPRYLRPSTCPGNSSRQSLAATDSQRRRRTVDS